MAFEIINKSEVHRDMSDPPPVGRLIKAFNGDWSQLSDKQLMDTYNTVSAKLDEAKSSLKGILISRGIWK